MTLDLLYARIPIELHEKELDRVCTSYRRELCNQLLELTREVSQHDLIKEDELGQVQQLLMTLDTFVSPTEMEARQKETERKEAQSHLAAFGVVPSRNKKKNATTKASTNVDSTIAEHSDSSAAKNNNTDGSDGENSVASYIRASLNTSPSANVRKHSLNNEGGRKSTSSPLQFVTSGSLFLGAAARPESTNNNNNHQEMKRKISFIDHENFGRTTSAIGATKQNELAFAATPGGTSTNFSPNRAQNNNNNNNNNNIPHANEANGMKRTASVTFGQDINDYFHGNSENDPNIISSGNSSRRASLASLARKASLLGNNTTNNDNNNNNNPSNNSRRPSSVFSGGMPHPPQHRNSLFTPEMSAVKTDWFVHLEEAYLRAANRREELLHALRSVSENASGPNTMKCVSSTMWPETRQAINIAHHQAVSAQHQPEQQQQRSQQESSKSKPVVPSSIPQILPTAVRPIFSADGGIVSNTEDATITVNAPMLLPHSLQTWEELASDANPKPPRDPLTWDLVTQKDVDDYFAVMDKTPPPANPFTPLLEIMKYELTLFTFVQKNKRPPTISSTSTKDNKILKSSVVAKRMLQDSIAKLERLEALYDKEVNDFLTVCRAMQKLYIREKRDADGSLALSEKQQQTLEQLATMRASTIVDDEEFAVAGGRRVESPDVEIGEAQMRRGTMHVDVGVRCRVDQSGLLEELDKMMLDTSLRHNRIKRFMDYVDDFVDRIERFDDEVDNTLRCPVCRDVSTELVSFWPCGHVFCVNCVPEAEESAPSISHYGGHATTTTTVYDALFGVCGTNSAGESYVQNFNASSLAARVRFRHAGCGQLRTEAGKLRALVLGTNTFVGMLNNQEKIM